MQHSESILSPLAMEKISDLAALLLGVEKCFSLQSKLK